MKFYSIGEFATAIGKTVQTVRNWDNSGKFKPDHVSDGGHRYYSQKQIDSCLKFPIMSLDKRVVGFCSNVSSSIENNLDFQLNSITNYCTAHSYTCTVITCTSSDLLVESMYKLIEILYKREVSRLVLSDKEVICEFYYNLISYICKEVGVEIEILGEVV